MSPKSDCYLSESLGSAMFPCKPQAAKQQEDKAQAEGKKAAEAQKREKGKEEQKVVVRSGQCA